MKLRKKWIYLPVEVKSRELISKVFFADLATRSGFGVFIGRNGMNLSRTRFPRGVYFDKCLSGHKVDFHRHQVEKLGNILVSLDEEALIVNRTYAEARFTQLSIDLCSIIFVWGEVEASLIRERYGSSAKICVSGSPRVDCWRPQVKHLYDIEVTSIKKRFGDFILVNSNFGAGVLPESRYDEEARGYFKLRSVVRGEFLKLIRRIAVEFPYRNIVLRPHPSENHALWTSLASELPSNVHIIFEGSVGPWVRAASLLIHFCCTTAVEAWVANTPAISYEPSLEGYPNYEPHHFLPPALSLRLGSEEEVLSTIRNGFPDNSPSRSTELEIVKKYIDFDEHKLSSQKIISELKKLSIKEDVYQIPSFSIWKKFRSLVGRAKDQIGDIWAYRNQMHKNPGMNLDEITHLTERLLAEDTLVHGQLNVHQVDVDTFCLFRD